jgi:hypothetical protein
MITSAAVGCKPMLDRVFVSLITKTRRLRPRPPARWMLAPMDGLNNDIVTGKAEIDGVRKA